MNNVKLLVEESANVELLTEEVNGKKNLYLEGIFAQAEVVNGNKRFYKRNIMEDSINTYIREYVSKNKAIGEIDHPDYPMPKSKYAAIRITELRFQGNDVYGKALVLNTPAGQTVRGLLEGGYQYGVSTRALGSIKESNGIKHVQPGLMITAIDCVDNPSGPGCNPSALMESIDWSVNEKGVWVPKVDKRENDNINEQLFLEKMEQLIKGMKR